MAAAAPANPPKVTSFRVQGMQGLGNRVSQSWQQSGVVVGGEALKTLNHNCHNSLFRCHLLGVRSRHMPT